MIDLVLRARKIVAPIIFKCWITVAVPEVQDAEEGSQDPPELSDNALERLMEDCAGRMIDVWLPRNLERRLKAHIHRMNAQILAAGFVENDQEFSAEDVDCILVCAAKTGIKMFEQEDGVVYSETTGWPIGVLPEGD